METVGDLLYLGIAEENMFVGDDYFPKKYTGILLPNKEIPGLLREFLCSILEFNRKV